MNWLFIIIVLILLSVVGYYFRYYILNSSFIMKIVFSIVIILGICYLIYYAYNSNKTLTQEPNPHYNLLVDGSVYLNHPLKFSNLPLSVNENNGIEYTLSSWVYINDTGMSDQYRFLFGRTDDKTSVNSLGMLDNNNPCLYISPHSNNIVIICSTYTSKKDNIISLLNIPFQQWINVSITCKGAIISSYVNFKPIKEIRLDSVPKQDGDIHLCATDYPVNGLISNLLYVNKALEINQIIKLVGNQPNEQIISSDIGPYTKNNISILDDLWK
jgi:hypothetical protein